MQSWIVVFPYVSPYHIRVILIRPPTDQIVAPVIGKEVPGSCLLRASERRFNGLMAKRRFRVEWCIGTMKRLFGLCRAR